MKLTTTETGTTFDFEAETARRCGGCTLCCKLLPMKALEKGSNQRCRYQRHTGCTIYQHRPMECQMWSCRWLAAPDETAGMPRPDRAHYVIDMMFDQIRVSNEGEEPVDLDVVQIWMDSAFPDAAKDPALRSYMMRMAEQHRVASLLRWSSQDATAVFPPPLNADRQWHEKTSRCSEGFGIWSRLPPALRPPA